MRIGCNSPFKTLIACSQTPYFFLKVLRARVVNINRGRFIDRQRKGAGIGEEEKDCFQVTFTCPLFLSLFVHVHFCCIAETVELIFESTDLTRHFPVVSFFISYTTLKTLCLLTLLYYGHFSCKDT